MTVTCAEYQATLYQQPSFGRRCNLEMVPGRGLIFVEGAWSSRQIPWWNGADKTTAVCKYHPFSFGTSRVIGEQGVVGKGVFIIYEWKLDPCDYYCEKPLLHLHIRCMFLRKVQEAACFLLVAFGASFVIRFSSSAANYCKNIPTW